MINKIIHDESQIKYFYDNIMTRFDNTECWFFCMAARNKYLTKEEREEFCLGRSEMFARTILARDDFSSLLSKLKRYECNSEGYITKNNKPIPQKSLVTYANINPSSVISSLEKFKKDTLDFTNDILHSFIKGNNPDFNKLKSIHGLFETSFQNTCSRKNWLDVDLDVPKSYLPWFYTCEGWSHFVCAHNLKNYYVISTHSGYHMLFDTKEIKFNPQEIVDCLTQLFYTYEKICTDVVNKVEIIINKNGMIPLPGTLQGNYPVKFVNLEEIK